MDEKIKRKWLAALNSGRYKQAQKKLRVGEGAKARFCCLGVLCDLHAKETGTKWQRGGWYQGDNTELSSEVVEWAGLDSENPKVELAPSKLRDDQSALCGSLAELNDSGYTFRDIAKKIRAEL